MPCVNVSNKTMTIFEGHSFLLTHVGIAATSYQSSSRTAVSADALALRCNSCSNSVIRRRSWRDCWAWPRFYWFMRISYLPSGCYFALLEAFN